MLSAVGTTSMTSGAPNSLEFSPLGHLHALVGCMDLRNVWFQIIHPPDVVVMVFLVVLYLSLSATYYLCTFPM